MQHRELSVNDIGEVNVAFRKTDSSIDLKISRAQSLNDEKQDVGNDENDSLTAQDMMSFSWQIAQGVVSKKGFGYFNLLVQSVVQSI